MCFKPPKTKLPKPVAPTQVQSAALQIPETQPIQNQLPQTQSGADTEAATGRKRSRRSLFEIDLTIPGIGGNVEQLNLGPSNSNTGSATR